MAEMRSDRAATSAEFTPTTADARHGLVDGLRGLALLGIVIVNVEFIVGHADLGWRAHASAVDTVVRWSVMTVAELKVYPLFALLFGYGLSLQLVRAAAGGGTLDARFRRRMLGLGLLGVAHGVLFFPGDILLIYAIVGSLAFLLRRRSSASLIRVAVSVYAVASALWLLLGAAVLLAGAELDGSPSSESLQILATGSFGGVVAQHLSDWPATLCVLALIQGPAAYAFVLVGMALGRVGVLAEPYAHRGFARRVLVIGGPVGLVGGGVGAAWAIRGDEYTVLAVAIGFLVAPALSGAYVAALLLAWERIPTGLTQALRNAGRMSLSVYLLESVALSTLAYGYGVGLFGSLSPILGVLMALGVWVGLCLFAGLWLRFARFGPAEWALRSFSYGSRQPLLRAERG